MKTSLKISLTVQAEDRGLRIDKFLATLEEVSSRNYAKNLIDKKLVLINAKAVKASHLLIEGQKLEVSLPEITESALLPYNFKLDVRYEDADLLVVNKPSGMVVHPAAGHQQDTLVNALLAHTRDLSMKNEQRPGIVHRLDKETSGLLVVAKNDRAHENLSLQFKNKTSHRVYFALLDGQLPKTAGVAKSFLARHPIDRKRFASLKENNKIITAADADVLVGKWAVTHFSKIAQHSNMSYLRIKLETGRTHQIRVHMSEIGHPLVGDTSYGYSQKKKKELELHRFFLHAAELGFTHPKTNAEMLFKVGWPEHDNLKLLSFGFDHDKLSK